MPQLKRLNGNKPFNHYSPANYMAKNIGTLTFSKETIERFEKFFLQSTVSLINIITNHLFLHICAMTKLT